MFEYEDGEGGFIVNCENVAKSKSCLAVTRLLAADLMRNPYMTTGDFLREISDSDLQALIKGAEVDDNGEFALDDLLLIAMLLRQAEGLPPMQMDEECRHSLGQLIMFLATESLARKGLVKIYRENMSFGEDMGDKVIVEKI